MATIRIRPRLVAGSQYYENMINIKEIKDNMYKSNSEDKFKGEDEYKGLRRYKMEKIMEEIIEVNKGKLETYTKQRWERITQEITRKMTEEWENKLEQIRKEKYIKIKEIGKEVE